LVILTTVTLASTSTILVGPCWCV